MWFKKNKINTTTQNKRNAPLAQEHIEVARSGNPQEEWLYSPHILKLKNGRLLASYDISCKSGYISASDDDGKTWHIKAERNFYHGRLFKDGNRIYLLGHMEDLVILYSDDNGETWSKDFFMTEGEEWHQAPTSYCYKNGYIYLVMEKVLNYPNDEPPFGPFWAPNIMGIVVMRGKLGTDLTQKENWLFSAPVRFRDVVKSESDLDLFGVPFLRNGWLPENQNGTRSYKEYQEKYDYQNDKEGIPFYTHPIGWLETNVVDIKDPRHFWYDKTGKTLYLFSRAHTSGSGYCCVTKVVEKNKDGKDVLEIELIKAPSGKTLLFLPMPGGQMKFYVLYDETTKLYWLISTQATDTMCAIEHLKHDRYNIPCDERDRLALHFSKNMVDWCFAGLVAKGETSVQSRHYASMDIDGDDLVILSRSGDKDAASAHHGNLITFHRIKNFRALIY